MKTIPESALATFDPMVDIVCVYLPDDAESIEEKTFPRILVNNEPLTTRVFKLKQSAATKFFPAKVMLVDAGERRDGACFVWNANAITEYAVYNACLVYYVSDHIQPQPFVDEDVFVFAIQAIPGKAVRYDGRANIYLQQLVVENEKDMYHVFLVAREDYEFLLEDAG